MLDRSSPAGVLDRIHAPTLLVQGTQDSLFGLGQADANARGIAANGTAGEGGLVRGRARRRGLGPGHRRPARPGRAAGSTSTCAGEGDDPGTGFQFPAPDRAGQHRRRDRVQGGNQTVRRRRLSRAGRRRSRPARRRDAVRGAPQPVVTPAGGTPAALTTVPGLGSLTAALGGTTLEIPGQFAAFDSAPLDAAVEVVGAPTTRDRRLRAGRHGHAVRQALRRRARRRHDAARRPGRAAGADRPLRPTRRGRRRCRSRCRGSCTASRPATRCGWSSPPPTRPSRCRPQSAVYSVGPAGDGVAARGARGERPHAGRAPAPSRWWVLLGVLVALGLLGWAVAELLGPAPPPAGVGRRARRRGRAAALRGRDQGVQGRLRRRPRPVLRGAPRAGARPARARTAPARRRRCGCSWA